MNEFYKDYIKKRYGNQNTASSPTKKVQNYLRTASAAQPRKMAAYRKMLDNLIDSD